MDIELAKLSVADSHTLLAEVLSPRLVTLVSTIGPDDVPNVAPFSSVGIICYKPSIIYVGISSRQGQKKDTLQNIEFSGDFVISIVDEALAEPMNKTATELPNDVDEFQVAGLTAIASDRVKSPRVKESPISLECKLMQILQFGEVPVIRNVVFGEVLLVHIKDDLYSEGKVSKFEIKAICHFGGGFYCRTRDVFELKRL